jgi:predicted GIY-YIG superfamily endonuclease
MSTVTNQIFTISYSVNCGNSNLVYLITYILCHSQYVGTSSQTLRNRFNHHLTAIKNKYWHDTKCPEHFNSDQHSIEHVNIIIE